MKKVIAFIISTCMIFGMTYSVLAENKDLTSKQEEAFEVLYALGYINKDYSKETVMQKNTVTRAEFADFIGQAFVLNKAISSTYFHDVPPYNFASNAINSLVDLNIISVNVDRMFYPDRNITPAEAAKMLLAATGYNDMIAINGGYPNGVNIFANKVELFDGVTTGKEISYVDMIKMLYNALNTEMLSTDEISSSGGLKYSTNGDTYFSKMLGIYTEKDIVYSCGETTLNGKSVNKDNVMIGDRILEENNINTSEYFGMQVKYVYRYDDKNDISTLIWLEPTQKRQMLMLKNIENDISFDEDTYDITYYTNEGITRKKVSIPISVNIIYNGRYVESGNTEVLKKDFYSIKLVSNDDNEYDTAIIEDYTNYVVYSVDMNNETLYLKGKNADNGSDEYIQIKLSDYDSNAIYNESGGKLELSSVNQGCVVSVYQSADKEYIKIVTSNHTEDAKIETVSNEGDYLYLKCGGNEYITYKRNLYLRVTVGNEVSLKLDSNGYIADVDLKSGSIKFGYMVNADVEKAFDDYVNIKIYDDSGSMNIYKTNKDLKLNGILYKTAQNIYQALGGKNINSGLIAFSVNANDQIIKIDTPQSSFTSSEKNQLVCLTNFQDLYSEKKTNKLGKSARIGSNTIVFGIPISNIKSDRLYSIGSKSAIEDDTWYTASIYEYGTEYQEYASVVIIRDKVIGQSSFLSTKVLVENVKTTLNADGETVIGVEGYHGSTLRNLVFTYDASQKSEVKSLKKGDIIQVDERIGEEINKITVIYSPRTDIKPLNTTYSNGARITSFYVNDVIGSSIMGGYESGAEFDEIFAQSDSTIYIYDKKTDTIKRGSISDMVSFKVSGESCDWVFIYLSGNSVRNFIIYR